MITSILTLFLVLAAPLYEEEQLIDNNRVTLRQVKGGLWEERKGEGSLIGTRDKDVVAIDLDRTTAYFLPKGKTHGSPQHGIVIDLKNVSVLPVENISFGVPAPRREEGSGKQSRDHLGLHLDAGQADADAVSR